MSAEAQGLPVPDPLAWARRSDEQRLSLELMQPAELQLIDTLRRSLQPIAIRAGSVPARNAVGWERPYRQPASLIFP